jgi:hypothetical protein
MHYSSSAHDEEPDKACCMRAAKHRSLWRAGTGIAVAATSRAETFDRSRLEPGYLPPPVAGLSGAASGDTGSNHCAFTSTSNGTTLPAAQVIKNADSLLIR